MFAPTDAAFAKVPKKTLQALGNDKAKLRSVLLYHVARGKLPPPRSSSASPSRRSTDSPSACRVPDGKVFVAGARVTTPDVTASNGVIHVINRVLIPR